ncbi:hypothetical protein, partial [Nonomuraea dietziae]|uniref:hypothetical protein n=1 Tax=Nonomuraea dietziae TaxID=65515 RepID=UPI0031DA6814
AAALTVLIPPHAAPERPGTERIALTQDRRAAQERAADTEASSALRTRAGREDADGSARRFASPRICAPVLTAARRTETVLVHPGQAHVQNPRRNPGWGPRLHQRIG